MSSPTPDRKALEDLWRLRLHDAKLRLDLARNYLKEFLEDFSLKDLSRAEGKFAWQEAVRAESLAQREYSRLRRVYRDLTINGVIPDEGEWLKVQAASG